MKLTQKARDIYSQISAESTKLGTLRKLAKETGNNHQLALELWATGEYLPRLFAILVMDKKQLSQDVVDNLVGDMQNHNFDERNYLMDWLMANQLTKSKETIALIESWENSSSPLQRRIYWYYQARLRWTGQTPPENTAYLLSAIENNMATEEPEVQWAMNFTAGWIGVYDKNYRDRCIKIGLDSALYKDEKVAKGCTPNYLPAFIEIEVRKREK
ncbi:DNA alkylation repair protein [Sinomicrobium sp.]